MAYWSWGFLGLRAFYSGTYTRALDRIFKLNEEIISRLHQTVRVIVLCIYIHAGQIADFDLEYIYSSVQANV